MRDLALLTRCLLCACGVFALSVPSAAADDLTGVDLAGLSLEELLQLEVRVASRIPASALTAASSVEVIPESVWQRRGVRTVADVLGTVPGISVTPAPAGANAFAIRGFTRPGSLAGVLITWDGVPLNDLLRSSPTLTLPGLNLGAVDEVQIVEGPGSALYGTDAFHGVIALRPYENTAPAREVHADVRSNDFYSAGTRFSGAVGEHAHLSVAIAADGQADQDLAFAYADPVTGTPRSGERDNRYGAQSASFKVRGDAGDDVSWRGGALLHHYDGEDFQGFGTRLAGVRDFGGIDTDFLLVDGGVRLGRSSGAAFDLSAYAWSSDSVFLAGRSTFDFEFANEQTRWGVHGTYEKTLAGASTQLAVVVGAERLAVGDAVTRNYDFGGTLTATVPHASAGAQRRVYNATVEGQTRWSAGRWLLVYGVRADDYSDFGSQLSPRVGLIWHADARNAVKLLYGSAFNAPSANQLRGTPGLIQPNSDLEPETIDTTELVVMHQADRWFMQGAVFHSSWRDGLASVVNAGNGAPLVFTNIERNGSHGVTWKLNWQGDPWLVNVGASWVRSENETTHADYSAFPRYIVDVEAGYNHAPWKTRFYIVQHWQIETDDVFEPSAGIASTALPQYSRTDIGAARALGRGLTLRVSARNVFDRDNFYPSSAGTRGGIPDYPRTFGAEIRYAF